MTPRDQLAAAALADLQAQIDEAVGILSRAHTRAAQLAVAGYPDEARLVMLGIRDILLAWITVLERHDTFVATGPQTRLSRLN